MKKLLSLTLCLAVLMLGMMPALAESGIQDGTYSYTMGGHNGDVTVTLTIEGGKIADAQQESIETQGIGTVAWDIVRDSLVNDQSLNVDAVAGATVSRAVFTYAAQQCLEQAGANLDDFKPEKPEHTPEEIAVDTDVLVVGSGIAGLTAAIEAANGGLKVLLVEKLTVLGGASIRCDGLYYSAGNPIQQAMGIEDSADQMYEDAVALFTSELVDPEIIRVWADKSAAGFDFLTEQGVEWADFVFPYRAIHAPRVSSVPGAGAAMVSAVIAQAKANDNITIINNTAVTELIQGEDKAVTGAKAVATNGDTYTINAKAVVLATGGFAHNPEMVTEHGEPMVATTAYTNPNMGDGYKLAESVGAKMQDSPDSITMYVDNESGKAMIGAVNPELFIVNPEGERFTNGALTANDLAHEALIRGYEHTIAIFDQAEFDALADVFAPELEKGVCVTGATPAELAAQLDINPDTLTATIERYNALCDAGEDEDFGRPAELLKKLEGTLYAITLEPNTYESFSGPQINASAQVIDVDGSPIPGLYAAGGITMWQVTDYHYMGCGSSINNAVVFGMTAADSILANQ